MRFFKDSIKDDDNLALPLEIDGGHWDGAFRRFLWALSFFVIALTVLAVFAPVREVALAEGQIIPVGSVVSVEHLEGGIVDTVYVGEGGLVNEGDLLLKLRSESGSGDFNQMRVRRALLELRRIRLSAHLSGERLDYAAFEKDYPKDTTEQRQLYDTERKAIESAGKVLSSRLDQRQSDIEARTRELTAIDSQIAIYTEQLGAQSDLVSRGFSSRARLLQAQARLEEVRVSRAQLIGAIEAAKGGVVEIQNEMIQAVDAKRQEWSDALVQTNSEISELDERLTAAQDRVRRLAVLAPRTGIVQSLAATLPGQVVRPGDVVAEIVPIDASVEAEVRIQPKDIGYIQVGHPAEITLSTFDPEVFGKVKGAMRTISPSTFENDKGEKYFKGLVELERNSLDHNGKRFPITAGMAVSASVTTGSKSVMQYILKPVVRSFDRAFSER